MISLDFSKGGPLPKSVKSTIFLDFIRRTYGKHKENAKETKYKRKANTEKTQGNYKTPDAPRQTPHAPRQTPNHPNVTPYDIFKHTLGQTPNARVNITQRLPCDSLQLRYVCPSVRGLP